MFVDHLALQDMITRWILRLKLDRNERNTCEPSGGPQEECVHTQYAE